MFDFVRENNLQLIVKSLSYIDIKDFISVDLVITGVILYITVNKRSKTMMVKRTNNIVDWLDYATLDVAIAKLVSLREEHGGDAILNIGLETDPYEDEAHIEIAILTKDV